MNDCANMARRYEREIPEGYEARIEGNKIIMELIEPKETEDEKIRKEIIEYLTVTREKDLVGRPERRRWITYLEKQKTISDSLKAAGIDVHQDGSIERHTVPYLEKQKEQKDYRKLYEDITNSEWYKNAYVGKSLGEEDEQKPAEWSEEDYKIIESINTVFDACAEKNIATEETTLYKLRAWLKFLPKRINLLPMQEWNEEDKRVCDGIIAILEAWDRSHTVSSGIQSMVPKYCLWLETRLKSLCSKPNWKPSEDQMKILRKYVMGEWRDLTIGQDKILTSLYIDLEKL